MKKLKLLLLMLASCAFASGQINQINIVNFTVKSTLSASPDSWMSTPGALLLTAQKVPGMRVLEPRLVIQIKSGPALVCGNNPGTARPIDPFDVRTFNTADLLSILGNCRELKEGNYTICVQFFNVDKVAISREVCKDFKVEAATVDYAPPTLITPENDRKFTLQELQRPVTFRWTPLVPKPREPITYKLRVWQLMQGQNAAAAMRSNQPIAEKEARDLTQTTVTNLLTGPCKPPYLCEFVWNVQALNRAGKPVGRNNGNSEPYTFKVQNNIDIEIDSLSVGCCENGKQNIFLSVQNNLAGNVRILAIKYKINGVGASITLSPLSPVLPVIIPGNGSQIFTSSINCIDTASTLKFLVDAEDVADPDNTETEVATDTLNCRCNACDEKNFIMNVPKPSEITWNNNALSFNQLITITTVPPKTIKSIKAELVYFEMIPQNDQCIPCDKDATLYGHFSNGTNNQQWFGTQTNLSINITTPNMPCCSTLFRWCIRYKVEFTDCTVCSKVICYEKKKEGCTPTGGGTDTNNNNNPK